MGRRLIVIGALLAGTLACGCSEKLETGYEPHQLTASSAERRGYYASPYTPEAIAAEQHEKAPAGPSPGFRAPGQ
jgi:hypothetical protein